MKEEKLMNSAEMDRILSRRDEIVPSSGFVASVMEAVRREAAAPAPIPFPWKRALPIVGLAVGAVILILLFVIVAIIGVAHGNATVGQGLAVDTRLGLWPQGTLGSALAWAAVSLVAAFIALKLSMRLAGDTR